MTMTPEQRSAAIAYMIDHADECTTSHGNPKELVYQILVRIMPPQIVAEAIRKAIPTDESKDCL